MISTSTLLSLLASSVQQQNTTNHLPLLTPTLAPCPLSTQTTKLLQIEAIKLIQISLDKLTSNKCCLYKENLYKNLFISKILNKSKLYYYQSIVNTLRCTLVTKLTYLINTNKNLKHLISSSSSSAHDGGEKLNEDEYINLIIKEAIDNLVNNNNVVVDDATAAVVQQEPQGVVAVEAQDNKKRRKLSDDDDDVESTAQKRFKLSPSENDCNNNNSNIENFNRPQVIV